MVPGVGRSIFLSIRTALRGGQFSYTCIATRGRFFKNWYRSLCRYQKWKSMQSHKAFIPPSRVILSRTSAFELTTRQVVNF